MTTFPQNRTPKPSEYLKRNGWIPDKSNVSPGETMWRKGALRLEFIRAYLYQQEQDERQEQPIDAGGEK